MTKQWLPHPSPARPGLSPPSSSSESKLDGNPNDTFDTSPFQLGRSIDIDALDLTERSSISEERLGCPAAFRIPEAPRSPFDRGFENFRRGRRAGYEQNPGYHARWVLGQGGSSKCNVAVSDSSLKTSQNTSNFRTFSTKRQENAWPNGRSRSSEVKTSKTSLGQKKTQASKFGPSSAKMAGHLT